MYKINILLLLFTQLSFAQVFEIRLSTPSSSINETHIQNKSLSWEKLSTLGAIEGDVLFFNGVKWGPSPLTGLNFKGSWNPNTNQPTIGDTFFDNGQRHDAVSGDYFIVTEATFDNSWGKGDWIIFNGDNWERINNGGVVKSIFGRKGNVFPKKNDIAWEDLDFSGSHLYDLSDIQTIEESEADAFEGFVLKWSVGKQKFELKPDEEGFSGEVESSDIVEEGVENQDISETANIHYKKINGFDQDLEKLKYEGGEVDGLDITDHQLIALKEGFVKIIYPDNSEKVIFFEDLYNQIEELKEAFNLKENAIIPSGNPDDFMSGEINLVAQTRVFKYLNLDYAVEDGENKFLTDENVWNSKISEYVKEDYSAEEVTNTDSLSTAIGKIDAQLSSNQLDIKLDTPTLVDKSIEIKHFTSEFSEKTGFLSLSENDPKKWEINSLSGLQYKGDINLNSDAFPVADNLSGDYYVISENFDDSLGSSGVFWNKGDWGIYNGTEWLQINNTGKVFEFNGRQGEVFSCPASECVDQYDYSWKMLDLTNSKLTDIENVPTPGADDNGKVLKYIGGSWVLENDKDGSELASIGQESIGDNVIRNNHVLDVGINQINNLNQDLNNLLNKSGGNLNGNLDFNSNKLLGVGEINGEDFAPIIELSNNFQDYLDQKQDKIILPSDTSKYLLLGDKTFEKLTTGIVLEGSTNLYFTEDRALDAKSSESFTFSGGNTSIVYDENDSSKQDTIIDAIRKINERLGSSATSGEGIVDEDSIISGTVSKEKLALADYEGQTILFQNDQWRYSSITGLNYVGDWDATTTPDTSISPGDYYIVSVSGTYNGVTYRVNDWAIYTGSDFQRISKSEKVTSFNGRIGDISPAQDDYTWEMINKDISLASTFPDVEYTLGSSLEDQKKTLSWSASTNKWVPKDDITQLTAADLTKDNFSTGEDSAKKAITAPDIKEISFGDINGLNDYFETNFINLSPSSGDVAFDNNLTFLVDGSGERVHKIENLDELVHSDGTRIVFDTFAQNCSLLDKDLYEIVPAGESSGMLLNANREWSKLKFSMIEGDSSSFVYNKTRIQNLKLIGFDNTNAKRIVPSSGNTSLLESIENLEAMAKNNTPIVIKDDPTSIDPEVIPLNESMNGTTQIFNISSTINLEQLVSCANLSDGFQVTLGLKIDVNNSYNFITIAGSGCLIEGQETFRVPLVNSIDMNDGQNTSRANVFVVTLKKIGTGSNSEFIVLSSK